jgi:DNA-binding NarL/FixJ family response regulator
MSASGNQESLENRGEERAGCSSSVNMIRLLVGEPLTLIREALKGLINNVADIAVVAEANSAESAPLAVRATQADVLLLAHDVLSESLLATLADIPERCRVLILTSDREPAGHARAVERGAMGIVMKDQTAKVLINAVRKVYAGEMWLDRACAAGIVHRLTRRRSDIDPEATKVEKLTARERQIVALIRRRHEKQGDRGAIVHQRGDRTQSSDVDPEQARFDRPLSAGGVRLPQGPRRVPTCACSPKLATLMRGAAVARDGKSIRSVGSTPGRSGQSASASGAIRPAASLPVTDRIHMPSVIVVLEIGGTD